MFRCYILTHKAKCCFVDFAVLFLMILFLTTSRPMPVIAGSRIQSQLSVGKVTTSGGGLRTPSVRENVRGRGTRCVRGGFGSTERRGGIRMSHLSRPVLPEAFAGYNLRRGLPPRPSDLSFQRRARVSTRRRSSCLPRSKPSIKPARLPACRLRAGSW